MLRRPHQTTLLPPIQVKVKDFPDDAPIRLTQYNADPTPGLLALQQNPGAWEHVCPFHSFNAGKAGCDRFGTCLLIHLNDASETLFKATGDKKFKERFFVLRGPKDIPLQPRGNAATAAAFTAGSPAAIAALLPPPTNSMANNNKNGNKSTPSSAVAAVIHDDDDDEVINAITNNSRRPASSKNKKKGKNRTASSSAVAANSKPPIQVSVDVKNYPSDPAITLEEYDAEFTPGLSYAQRHPDRIVAICPYYSFNTGTGGCTTMNCPNIHLNKASATLFRATGDKKFKNGFFGSQPTTNSVHAKNHQQAAAATATATNTTTANGRPPKIEVAVKDFPDDEPIVLTNYTAAQTSGLNALINGSKTVGIICPYYSFNGGDHCVKGKNCGYIHLDDASNTLFKASGEKKFKGSFYVKVSSSSWNSIKNNSNNNNNANRNDDDDDDETNAPHQPASPSASLPSTTRILNRPTNFKEYVPSRRAFAFAQTFGEAPPTQVLEYEVELDKYEPPKDKFDADTFPRNKSEAMDPKYRHAADLPSIRRNLIEAGAILLTAEKFAVLPQNELHPTAVQLSKLKPSRYRYLLHMRSWIDEIRCQVDLLQFSQENLRAPDQIKSPERGDRVDFVRIKIPGVAESRPSVLRGDQILCSVHCEDRWDGGVVHFVNHDEIVASFHSTAAIRDPIKRSTQGFDVQFTFGNRTLTRSIHRAIDVGTHLTRKVIQSMDQPCTFWKVGNIATSDRISKRPLNEEQAAFVNNVCSTAAAHILSGPPGTGKTVSIVAAILAVYELSRVNKVRCKILVACPTNAAADLIVERIDEVIHGWDTGKPSMQRIHALNRQHEHVSKEVRKHSVVSGSGFLFPEKSVINNLSIVVCTLASAARMYSRGIEANHFTHVFVDEAGQVTEEEMMVATTFVPNPLSDLAPNDRATSLILAGDSLQLGPIIHSGLAREAGMGVSALERLTHVASEENVVHLVRNYRSHPAIVSIVNVTYNDKLIPSRVYSNNNNNNNNNRGGYHNHFGGAAVAAATDVSLELLPQYSPLLREKIRDGAIAQTLGRSFAKNPVMFIHNEGPESRDDESPSWQNVSERFLVVDLVRTLINFCGKRCKDITVLTPYIAQRKKIDSAINFCCFHRECGPAERIRISDEERQANTFYSATGKPRFKTPITVCTVEAYQGKENRIIIVSCVRSQETKNINTDVKFALGFLSQYQRTNVALSRAQDAMIIVGNSSIFLRDPARFSGAANNGGTYDRDRTTAGLWDGYLQRISDFAERTAPRVLPSDGRPRYFDDPNHDHYDGPVVIQPGRLVSNFVNLANPNQTLDDLRASLGRLAYANRKSSAANETASDGSAIDDDNDEDDSGCDEGQPQVREE